VSLLGVLVFYALLFAWTFGGERVCSWLATRWGGEEGRGGLLSGPTVRIAALALLALLAVLVWGAALSAPDGRLHLTVLDVGSGDGLLIQTPSGRTLLVDGGPSPNRLSDLIGRRLPLTDRNLDWLVVAAAGEEQLAALPSALERFPPGEVLWSGPPAGSYSARRLRRYLAEARIPITPAEAGQSLDLGEGATLELLTVTRRGAVLLLEWGEFSALLPIGLDFESLEALMAERGLGTVTALLLAEGGYAPLNTPEWIARWRPQVVLLSVAAGDEAGRPDPETLAAVDGYTLLRTDLDGWIHLSTDGERMWVEVER
jgi:competence protein ComEC